MKVLKHQRLWRIWLALAICCGFAIPMEGASLAGQYIIRTWRSADGVTTGMSRCIAQDADQSLWVGTFDGVFQIRGDHSSRFIPEVSLGYHSGWFISLLSRRNGSLWAGTAEGLRRFEKGDWVQFPASANPPSGMAEWLVESPAGVVYASISNNCFAWDGKTFNPFPTPHRLPGDVSPARLVFDEAGALWARTDTVLARYESGDWRTVLAADPSIGSIRGIGVARRGGIWVATDEKVMRYRGQEVDRVTRLPELLRGDWLQLFQDSRGDLWIGGLESGLAVLSANGRMLGGTTKGDYSSERIFCFGEDSEGNVYAGCNGQGLLQIRPRRSAVVLPEGAGPGNEPQFNTIAVTSPGTIIAGTAKGTFYQVSIPTRQATLVKSPLPGDESINALLVDRSGRLWAGTQSKGLWRSSTLQPKDLELAAPSSAPINALYEDRQHNLFVGTGEGVFLLRGSSLEPAGEGASTKIEVTCFATDNADRIWIGSSSGLLQYKQGAVLPASAPANVPLRAAVAALHVDRSDNLWVGFRDGTVLVRHEDHWLAMPKTDLFQTPGVNVLADDATGRLWAGYRFGLMAFSIREILDFMEGKGPRPTVIQLSANDDLGLGDDFSSTGNPGWCADERGGLWFANSPVLLRVNPATIPINRRTVDVKLVDVLVGNRPIAGGSGTNSVVHLPHGASPVVLKYEAPLFTTPERTLFEYRLDSRDVKWNSNGRNRELRFADLSPGRHRIEIRAINSDGVGPEQGTVFQLELHPYLYEIVWFQGGAAAVALALVALAGRRGLRRYVKKREALLEAREAAARAELTRVSLEADRMRLEARLHESQRLEALGTLAGGIAHDFNNLLQTIMGNAELGRLAGGNPGEAREHFDEVAKAAERARVLVAQILLFSRRDKPRRIPLLAGPVVKETLKMLRSGIPPAVEFDISIPDDLPPILGDPSAIQRIVANLGTNAAHAMRAHGGKLVIRLGCREFGQVEAHDAGLAGPGKYLYISMEDSGHGMDAETRRRVFEPFFTTKPPGEGTGLGLSVVQGLVKSLEGGIHLRSQPGAGTTVEVFLPVTQEVPVPETVFKVHDETPKALRIMIVDDEQAVLDFAVAAVKLLGHLGEGYNSPELAISRFGTDPAGFDLVVTDLTMPVMDGRVLESAIHAILPAVPIILATGYGEGMDESSAVASGFAALMAKPYTVEMLASVIARVMARQTRLT